MLYRHSPSTSHTLTQAHLGPTPTPSAVLPETLSEATAALFVLDPGAGSSWSLTLKSSFQRSRRLFPPLASSEGAVRRIKCTLVIRERLMTLTRNLFHASVASLSDRPPPSWMCTKDGLRVGRAWALHWLRRKLSMYLQLYSPFSSSHSGSPQGLLPPGGSDWGVWSFL